MRNSPTLNLKIDKSQLVELINQLDYKDKIEVLDSFVKSTYIKRFKKLLSTLRTNELSLDDITREVEIVRKKNYEAGKHKI
jgi:hypothetical protein